MPETVDSTSDDRTVNNRFRHKYRVLHEGEKNLMEGVKNMGAQFDNLLQVISATTFHENGEVTVDEKADPERLSSRELSAARTKIEEAVMWAVKHVTR